MDIAIDFIHTRSRRHDPSTSKEAAKNAASIKAHREREAIKNALLNAPEGLTASEIATVTGMDYYEVQRRKSEISGVYQTDLKRDKKHVWRAQQ